MDENARIRNTIILSLTYTHTLNHKLSLTVILSPYLDTLTLNIAFQVLFCYFKLDKTVFGGSEGTH